MGDLNRLRRSFSDMSKSSEFPGLGLNGLDHPDAHTEESVPSISPMGFNPRGYQKKVFDVAMKRNTIAVLETGSGKTLIAVMLIREISQSMKSSGDKKLMLFLAPTVHLVNQQHGVIKVNTNFQVGEYYGAKGVDSWNLQDWEKEINKHDVMVMTPQILLDALRKAFLNLEMVSLIIIDECHRSTGNHPYAKIMKEFYHKLHNKPKVFGMTASPVVRKGVSSSMDCEDQISELESVLDSLIYTIEDKAELDVHVPSARETRRFYDKAQPNLLDLRCKIEASWSKFDASLLSLQGSKQSSYKDVEEKLKTLRQRLSNDHANILHCMEDLGLLCAYEAIKVCLEKAPNSTKESEIYAEISLKHKCFLEEVLNMIVQSLPCDEDPFLLLQFDHLQAINLGYISPKLYELLQVFLSFGEAQDISCLIFVDRIITAKVIERFVKKVAVLTHFTVSYVTGTNTSINAVTSKTQKETLESFRSGKVNLLFATDVLREGIHVPNCACVICFDLPKTECSYVQSRGRARQNDSQYIIMLERGNMKQIDQLFNIIRSEWLVTNTAINRDPDDWNRKALTTEEVKAYIVDGTGASVTADSSVSLIYRYCEKLPADRYFTPRPTFELENFEQSCRFKMDLPASAALQTVIGPVCRNKQLARQLVCLEACKQLHQTGALDDYLQPLVEELTENNCAVESQENAGAGTTKRKELHGTTSVHALSGSWGEKLDGTTFCAYKFDFSCSIDSEKYSGFVLLIESKLDDDVGNIELDLFLLKKMVRASVSSCGQVHLDAEKIAKAKCFHELFFNGLFGKLFMGSKSPREFLPPKLRSLLWSSYMYLLLPLETFSATNDESWKINWTGIDVCSNVVDFLRNKYFLGVEQCNHDDGRSSQGNHDEGRSSQGHHDEGKSSQGNHDDGRSSQGNHDVGRSSRVGLSATERCGAYAIHLANISVGVDKLKNMVVLAIHTGKIYSVLGVASNIFAESPFEPNASGSSSKYSSYAEYFNRKYGIVLMHPTQPLLRLKPSHKPHNLLANNDEDTSRDKMVVERQRQIVHMPPELLISVDIPVQTLKSFYLLPSLMYRLESLMLASQLRQEIGSGVPDFHIPSSLILEALTTERACEAFSMERLELLGDSVLKYAVSCDLFLRYPKKHEGQLSAQRKSAICNSTLHKFGTSRKLQGYIRDGAFIPRSWVAPGHRPTYYVPCNCGVNTREVPLASKFQTEDPTVKIGTRCPLGHRWMCSKTISDCVEALIGAYYVGGGLMAALHLMKWLGMDVAFSPSLVDEAITSASLQSYTPKEDEIKSLESKLEYTFSIKFLLQEAMTHPSMQYGYCYERLEFLGDAVLDLLITSHLFQNHTNIDPGELTDLRSACVSNENFAQVIVRQGLHKHLDHCSALLENQIAEYVESFSEYGEATKWAAGPKGPKALGDLLESIAGAMLIDTRFNLDDVWRVLKPLLSPLATPQNLELPPFRELNELCDSFGYFVKENCVSQNETVHAELRLQLNDVLLVGKGCNQNKKAAKGIAASHLLKELERRGITRFRGGSKRKQDPGHVVDSTSLDLTNEDTYRPENHKKQKLENQLPAGSSLGGDSKPVIESINMKKGGPRNTLFDLCKKEHWTMPTFETTEQSRAPVIFGQGSEAIKRYNSFVAKIKLNIPNHGPIECKGEPRPDKKSSFDSAAIALLYELQQQGQLIISSSN